MADMEWLDAAANSTTTSSPVQIPESVRKPVTILVTVIILMMMCLLLQQVFRVWYYGYSKLSYFNASLSMCLAWSIIRSTDLLIYLIHDRLTEDVSVRASIEMHSYHV